MKSYEKIVMNAEELDDGSQVINLDLTDEYNIPTHQNGYVMVRKDWDDGCFYVTVIGSDGSVISETVAPFNFQEI